SRGSSRPRLSRPATCLEGPAARLIQHSGRIAWYVGPEEGVNCRYRLGDMLRGVLPGLQDATSRGQRGDLAAGGPGVITVRAGKHEQRCFACAYKIARHAH